MVYMYIDMCCMFITQRVHERLRTRLKKNDHLEKLSMAVAMMKKMVQIPSPKGRPLDTYVTYMVYSCRGMVAGFFFWSLICGIGCDTSSCGS